MSWQRAALICLKHAICSLNCQVHHQGLVFGRANCGAPRLPGLEPSRSDSKSPVLSVTNLCAALTNLDMGGPVVLLEPRGLPNAARIAPLIHRSAVIAEWCPPSEWNRWPRSLEYAASHLSLMCLFKIGCQDRRKLCTRVAAVAGVGDRQVMGSPACCRAWVLRELRVGRADVHASGC